MRCSQLMGDHFLDWPFCTRLMARFQRQLQNACSFEQIHPLATRP